MANLLFNEIHEPRRMEHGLQANIGIVWHERQNALKLRIQANTHTVAVPSTAIKQKHIYYDDRRLASNKIVAFRYRHKRNNPFYWKQNRQLCRTIINKYCLPIKRNLTARAVNGWFYVVHVCVRARVSCATRFIPTVSRIRLLYRFVPCTYKRRKTWIEQT